MRALIVPGAEIKSTPTLDRYESRINYANKIRELYADPSILAVLCCAAIRAHRRKERKHADAYLPANAYILDQFKRKEEIEALRQVYGKLFIGVSIYSDKHVRIRQLAQQIADDESAARAETHHEAAASNLITKDEEEAGEHYGQRLRDAFPLADVFVDINAPDETNNVLGRFFRAFFGANDASPTKDEYGMHLAKTAALRSLDLSRQVGAAAFSSRGEVISLGCNEVPKPGGGTYWEGDSGDSRDYVVGHDENEIIKRALLSDVVRKLFLKHPKKDEILAFVMSEAARKGSPLRETLLMDLLEFGRVIHAEMSAIADAARLGLALRNATLYCTTFPCHICAKHIIAAGFKKVVFIEPYPKSYAERLHGDSILVKAGPYEGEKLQFAPFIGVSPLRFRELFERGRRKNDRGEFVEWAEGRPKPIVKYTVATYLHNELALTNLFQKASKLLVREGKLQMTPVKNNA